MASGIADQCLDILIGWLSEKADDDDFKPHDEKDLVEKACAHLKTQIIEKKAGPYYWPDRHSLVSGNCIASSHTPPHRRRSILAAASLARIPAAPPPHSISRIAVAPSQSHHHSIAAARKQQHRCASNSIAAESPSHVSRRVATARL